MQGKMRMTPERWHRVEQLFQDALDRPAAERHTFLKEACGSDEELRREVESLLSRQTNSEDFRDEVGKEIQNLYSRGNPHTPLPAGAQLGPYRIEELLGRGGMGEVYRARDTRLHRTVAIKILPAGKTSDAERERRFLQEARAAS